MITKITLTLDVNPETLECTILKQETAKTSSTKSKVVDDNDPEPKITLEDNKYIFNQAAATLMGVVPEDRVAIRYKKIDKVLFPVIGKQEAFKIHSGNRVTKNLTVSCRGTGNEELAKYGSIFTVSPMKDSSDLFVMIGDTDITNNDEIDTTQADEESEIDQFEQEKIDVDKFEIDDKAFIL